MLILQGFCRLNVAYNLTMRLTYETGKGTLIQFILLSFLNIATALNSIIAGCRHSDQCMSNTITSIIFYLLIVAWFGGIWMLGYMAQDRRSKRLAQLLICVELFVALIALFNAKHHTDVLGLLTSVADLGLALWIVTLAFRLMRAGPGRLVKRSADSQRPRERRKPNVSV